MAVCSGGNSGMNWQFFACIGAVSAILVTVTSYGGWMPGEGGSWPLVLAFSMAAGALFGLCIRLVPQETWRKKR